MPATKARLARWLRLIEGDRLGAFLQRGLGWPFIRAVNYHDVPPARAEAFERQVRYFAERFVCVDPVLLAALHRGEWRAERPGLLLSFDDGLRSHADVVAPVLERYGWVGWFMVPGGFLDAPVGQQADFARDCWIEHSGHDYGDPRIAMTWDDAARLAGRHVVGCHTWSHRRLAASLGDDDLRHEIPIAKRRLEERLGREVSTFAWVGGEEASYSAQAASYIRAAGFQFGFMTNSWPIRPHCDLHQLQRTNVESWDSDEILHLQLSGLIDLIYTPKRRRVERLLSTSVSGF